MSVSASISTLDSFSIPSSKTAKRPTGPAPIMATSAFMAGDLPGVRGEALRWALGVLAVTCRGWIGFLIWGGKHTLIGDERFLYLWRAKWCRCAQYWSLSWLCRCF